MKYKVVFENKCVLEENDGPDSEKLPWILKEPLAVKISTDNCGVYLIVPAGFKTDLASVPSILHWFQDSYGKEMTAPSVLHDILYAAELLPRGMIDDIFADALRAKGMPGWKANICWAAVRTCGGFTYGEHTIERIKKIRDIAHCIPATMMRPLWRTVAEIKQ